MKKFLTLAAVAALLLGASSMVFANVCATDVVPAATLLYPYLVYDYNDPNNTSLFAVTNVSWEAQIVHFTLWTDYTQHVLDWNVILSGYDVQTFNLRDILRDGILPSTGTSGDFIIGGSAAAGGPISSPYNGGLEQPAGTNSVASRCSVNNPTHAYPNMSGGLPASLLTMMENQLTASQTVTRWHDDCFGESGDATWFVTRTVDDPTWMYITADVVWTCNRMFPDSVPLYWEEYDSGDTSGIGAQAMYDNVLIGDIFYINDSANLSEAITAVHLEADPDIWLNPHWTTTAIDGDPITFYHQYVEMLSVGGFDSGYGDYREPLPTAWAFRFLNLGSAMTTNIRVFKRATIADISLLSISPALAYYESGHTTDLGFPDGLSPDDPPLSMVALDCRPYTLYLWDEDEEPMIGPGDPPWSPVTHERVNLFPLETQEVNIEQIGPTYTSGWILLVWPWSNIYDDTDDYYQTYVSVQYAAFDRYSAALQGAVMANYNCFSDQRFPDLGVNYNYVSEWVPNGPPMMMP